MTLIVSETSAYNSRWCWDHRMKPFTQDMNIFYILIAASVIKSSFLGGKAK